MPCDYSLFRAMGHDWKAVQPVNCMHAVECQLKISLRPSGTQKDMAAMLSQGSALLHPELFSLLPSGKTSATTALLRRGKETAGLLFEQSGLIEWRFKR